MVVAYFNVFIFLGDAKPVGRLLSFTAILSIVVKPVVGINFNFRVSRHLSLEWLPVSYFFLLYFFLFTSTILLFYKEFISPHARWTVLVTPKNGLSLCRTV